MGQEKKEQGERSKTMIFIITAMEIIIAMIIMITNTTEKFTTKIMIITITMTPSLDGIKKVRKNIRQRPRNQTYRREIRTNQAREITELKGTTGSRRSEVH